MPYRHHLRLLFLCLLAMPLTLPAQTDFIAMEVLDSQGAPIDGDLTESGYEDQICITSFSWGVENTVPTSGGGASRPIQLPFAVSKAVDVASTPLQFAVFTSQNLNEVNVAVVATNPNTGRNEPRVEYQMRDVIVTSANNGGSVGEVITETLTFVPTEIRVIYYDDTGSVVNRYVWNFSSNTGNDN